jgi:hypothetical protein
MGGAAAALGGVLALIGNLAHPRWTDIEDVELYEKIADSGIWVADHLILVVALVLITLGGTALARSLEGGEGHALARYGLVATVVGGAIFLADISLDAFAFRQAAENFAGAAQQDRVGAFWAANAIDHVSTAMFHMATVVSIGVSPLLLGMAAIRNGRYPAALAWTAVVGGAAGILTGMAGLGGAEGDDLMIPFLVASLLVTIWIIGAGTVLWRTPERESVSA